MYRISSNSYDKNGSLLNCTVKGNSAEALGSSGTIMYTGDALDCLTAEKSAGRMDNISVFLK
ncbi:MAG: hypothetical protein ACI4FZ_10785 [Lachnospiraceae bacterium]